MHVCIIRAKYTVTVVLSRDSFLKNLFSDLFDNITAAASSQARLFPFRNSTFLALGFLKSSTILACYSDLNWI